MNRALPLLALCLLLAGCTTTQKTVAFQTLGTVQATVDASLQAYTMLVVAGKVDQATQVKVLAAKLRYEMAFKLMLEAAMGDTRYPAYGDVVKLANELGDLLALALKKR